MSEPYIFTEEDKRDTLKHVPFHIERMVPVERDSSKSSVLFDDDLLQEDPLEDIIDIILDKAPLYSSNNYDLDIIRDPGRKDVPSSFHYSEFWQTFFKHSLGPLYNELILYSYNRLKYPYITEISLLYDSIFESYTDLEKDIVFENTTENEELSEIKLNSTARFLGYVNPQRELIEEWLAHLVASAVIKESEIEREAILYRAQDLRNEMTRRKVAGSLLGYGAVLSSIDVVGSLFPAVPIEAFSGSKDARLSRGLALPGVTTIVPSTSVDPESLFPDIPSRLLIPAYYTSSGYNYELFLSNKPSYLRFKNSDVTWDNLLGITDISLVKETSSRLDITTDTLDDDPIATLDDSVPGLNLSMSTSSFLDIQASRIYNTANSLQTKQQDQYPYYIDPVAQGFAPSLIDVPWFRYIEKSIEEKKRVSEKVDIGMQLSLLDNDPIDTVTVLELGFAYRETLTHETEEYVYNSSIHNYMYIYSVEIKYNRIAKTIVEGYPKRTVVTIIYLKQDEASTEELREAMGEYEAYKTFTSFSSGLLPFKYKEIAADQIENYDIWMDETNTEEYVRDYIEESGYSKGYFYFTDNPHGFISSSLTQSTTDYLQTLASIGVALQSTPYAADQFSLMYGYAHEDASAYWSEFMSITRVDRLMAMTDLVLDWNENILYINPQLNHNPSTILPEATDTTLLQSLSSTHKYSVYNNDADDTTAEMIAASKPIGFYLQKTRPGDILLENETFQIWGDNREPSDYQDDSDTGTYRNAVLSDNFSVNCIEMAEGAAFTTTVDSYYDIVPSTVISAAVDASNWYWNKEESYYGMAFFTKFMFSTDGLGTDQTFLNRNKNIVNEAGDEFELYYDDSEEKFIFEVYPTGFSDPLGTLKLGELVFSVEIDYAFPTNPVYPSRLGCSYALLDTETATIKTVRMNIIIDGIIVEQQYTVTQTGTLNAPGGTTYEAYYTVHDDTADVDMTVNGSTTITLDDDATDGFYYNEPYDSGVWEHFLGMLHKDGNQSTYTAENRIELFQKNRTQPFIGKFYDVRLHTCGFTADEMLLHNRGTRRELFSVNIDSQKVHHHFSEDFAIGRRFYDLEDSLAAHSVKIRAFDRSKWNSIIIDPQGLSVGETTPTHDRYVATYADPAGDTDVYDGGDEAEGLIESFLKDRLEVLSGFEWDPNHRLYYKGITIDTEGHEYELVQTTLYPIEYKKTPYISNGTDGVTLVEDSNSLKAYKTAGETHAPGIAQAIEIPTTPSGDTLKYQCDMKPDLKMTYESFSARALYKGSCLKHVIDAKLDEVAVEVNYQSRGGAEVNDSRLLIMPLSIPAQTNEDTATIMGFSLKGVRANDVLKKLLDPASYYKEYIIPYKKGYRVDVVRSLKEGVYYLPITIPVMLEADYNSSKKKVAYNLETMMKVKVVGVVVDNSAAITDTTVETYYDKYDRTVNVLGYDADDEGNALYRRIEIEAYYYQASGDGDWTWQQIFSNKAGADAELLCTEDSITFETDIRFYLTDSLDKDEFFTWNSGTKLFDDRTVIPPATLSVVDSATSNPVNTPYFHENRSYLMYLNMRSVAGKLRFSSDVTTEPYESDRFENHNTNPVVDLLNDRFAALDLGSVGTNYGYKITTSSFDTASIETGILGDPYSNTKTNYLLNELDSNFIDQNIFTMQYKAFFASPDHLVDFPVGFYVNVNDNLTELPDSDGDLQLCEIDEMSTLESHYKSHIITEMGEPVSGFHSYSPTMEAPSMAVVTDITIDSEATLQAYTLSDTAKNVPKWKSVITGYDQFDLWQDIFYALVEGHDDETYDATDGFHLSTAYVTTPYTITLSADSYDTAYLKVKTSIATTVDGFSTSTTAVWISMPIVNNVITLTPADSCTLTIWDIKPYNFDDTGTEDYLKFLVEKQAGPSPTFRITNDTTFVTIVNPDEEQWHIQFKSTYTAATLSTAPAATKYEGNLTRFLDKNGSIGSTSIKNPWNFVVMYRELGDSVTIYSNGVEIENSPYNLLFIDHMSYNGLYDCIDIGTAAEDGIVLNNDPLDTTNLTLAGNVYLTNEKLTALCNCIDVEKVKAGKPSVNAITNVQIVTAGEVIYEMEFPPIIYDELTQHISFNILVSR